MWCAGPDKLSWYSSHEEQHCPVEIYRVHYTYVGNFTFSSSHVKTKQKKLCHVSYLFLCNILPCNLAATTTDMYYLLVSVGREPKSSLAGCWDLGHSQGCSQAGIQDHRIHVQAHMWLWAGGLRSLSLAAPKHTECCVCSQRWAPHCVSLSVTYPGLPMWTWVCRPNTAVTGWRKTSNSYLWNCIVPSYSCRHTLIQTVLVSYLARMVCANWH